MGSRRRDRHPQPRRRRGPSPWRSVRPDRPCLRARPPALGGGGDPGGRRRGPRQPDPHDGPGERAGHCERTRLGLFQRRRPHAGHPVCDPLGRAGAQQLRRRHLQRIPGGQRHGGRRHAVWHPPAHAQWSAAASCSTWPARSGATCSSRDIRSCPGTSTPPASSPASPSNRATSCSCAPVRWCISPRTGATCSPTSTPHPGSRSRRPNGSTPTTSRRSPPTHCPSKSSPASTKTPTCRCTSCTWSRWA